MKQARDDLLISFARRLPLSCLLLAQSLSASGAAAASALSASHYTFFHEPGYSASLIATGGAGVSLAEDGSGLYVNPAGLVAAEGHSFYADYFAGGDGRREGGGLSLILRRADFAVGAGYFSKEPLDGMIESVYSASAAWKIVEGAKGSFLSVGAAIRGGVVSYPLDDDCPVCQSSRGTGSGMNGDVGVMLRPLPVVSFAYSAGNIRETEFDIDGESYGWKRISRWGITWFWEQRLSISWERDHYCGSSSDHYGFSLRASSVLEIMAGFSQEKVSGGFAADIRMLNIAVAFMPRDEGKIETWISIGMDFGSGDEDGR